LALLPKVAASQPQRIGALAGNLVDVESMFALKQLMQQLGSPHLDCRQDGARIDASDRASYIMNTGIAELEQADVVLLIGTDPRREAPLVNSRLRKAYLQGGAQIFNLGPEVDLTYPVTQLGNEPTQLNKLIGGEHEVAKRLSEAQRPVVMIGAAALARDDASSLLNAVKTLCDQCNIIRDDWNGYNMLHYAAARVGGLDVGFVPQAGGQGIAGMIGAIENNEMDMLYLLSVDEIDMHYFGDAFIVYQGHHGDIGAHRADVILPGAAYTEKNAIYVNTEGRPQEAFRAVFPPGEAKEDWKILRALSERLGCTLPYDSQEELRKTLYDAVPHLAAHGRAAPASWQPVAKPSKTYRIRKDGFEQVILNYYMTDPISRASKTMAECTRIIGEKAQPHGVQEAA